MEIAKIKLMELNHPEKDTNSLTNMQSKDTIISEEESFKLLDY